MLNPLPASKWNYATAAHLWNRAGFGGRPEEIERLARLSPDEAVAFFVDYEKIPEDAPRPDWAEPNPERQARLREIQKMEPGDARREKQQEMQREENRHLQEMRGMWLRRMAHTPRPLQEKLTLFWHGHFATSAVKVREAYFMWRQIDTFRRLGNGRWRELLEAVATDPAMLLWLDQAQSRKEHPNENFAREVMELFTLGEGHYTEKDVSEAARAMTGWSLDRPTESYRFRPFLHDNGEKTFLGRTGYFSGLDILDIIVAQPQAATFITGKLWKFFGSEDASPDLVAALADVFRQGDGNFKPLLRAMFRSEEFYGETVVRSQIKSPTQWLVGSVRLLERPMPVPLAAADMIKKLGQDLLMPPNVKGWDGGLSWITTATLLDRYNDAATLVMGGMEPVDVSRLVSQEERSDKARLLAGLERRFLQARLSDKQRGVLRDYLERHEDLSDNDIRHAIRLLMSTPDYQLT
ncbi:MAG TPA: DUF1800 domain-containing protein [Verrucomicrobiae bacterium]|jgi:uncharacterized protein (DUF1800 family)|nr:DUF1800 domain-containing protein [Verrucomicrobiae bacterium]